MEKLLLQNMILINFMMHFVLIKDGGLMKKLILIFVLFTITLCSSCKNNKNETNEFDLKSIYSEHEYEIQRKTKKVFYNMTPTIIYLESSTMTDDEYEKYVKGKIVSNFEKIIIAYTNKKSIVFAAEFKNTEDALKEFNLNRQDVLLYDKYIFYDCGLTHELLYGIKDEKDYIISNNRLLIESSNAVLDLPESVERISRYAFAHNLNITNLSCNADLKVIGKSAFYGCANLTSIKLNNGLLIIEEKAFYDVNYEYIIIPQTVYNIGPSAFNKGIIYCESSEEDVNWSDIFATESATVYWKGEWSYVDGIPTPLID